MSRIAVVTSAAVCQSRSCEEFMKHFKDCALIQCVVRNAAPSSDEIVVVLDEIRNFNPDCIIAFGGGSVIDVAKIAWILYENSATFGDESAFVPPVNPRSVLAAWPTTFTGGHVTPYAIYSHNGIVRIAESPAMIPSVACFDSEYVSSLPPALVVHSCVHALSRVMDSAFFGGINDFTLAAISQTIKLITENLEKGLEGNNDALESLCNAATLAGQATTNTETVGPMGEISREIYFQGGAHYGAASLVLIPAVLKDKKDSPALKSIAESLVLSPESFIEVLESFCAKYQNYAEFIHKDDIPRIIKKFDDGMKADINQILLNCFK